MFKRERETSGSGMSCFVKTLLIVASLPALLAIVILIWWISRTAIAKTELTGRLAELESQGLPFDNETMQVYYDKQTERDNEPRWTAIADLINSPAFETTITDVPVINKDEAIPLDPDQAWPSETMVRDFLRSQAFVYEELDRLESTPGGIRYPITYEGVDTLLPYVMHSRSMARLMHLRHDVAVRDRDGEVAAQSVLTTMAVGRTLQGHPVLVSQLVRLAIIGQATNMIREGLSRGVYDEEGLRRIASVLADRTDEIEQLRTAMIGERAFVLTSMSQSTQTMTWNPNDTLATLDFFDELLADIGGDLYSTNERLAKTSEKLEGQFSNAGWLERLDTMMTGLLVPAIGTAGTAFTRAEMSLRLAETSVAVARYRATEGDWPVTLDELRQLESINFDAAANGPIGDRPFGYRVEKPDTAIVWGFPVTATPDFAAMTQTPDEPPHSSAGEDDTDVFQIAVPR